MYMILMFFVFEKVETELQKVARVLLCYFSPVVLILAVLSDQSRLDRQARIQFRRIHFGVFSMSSFVPPALSSNWTWPALSLSSIIRHLSYVRLDRWALLTVWVWYIFIFVLFPLYRSTDLAELWGTVKSCQITQMVEIRYVSQEQDDINCSSMPAGLGGKGKIDRKFEGNFERKWFRMKSAWEEAPKLMSP